MCECSSFFKFILFADDTTVVASHANFDTLISLTNSELDKIANWFIANELIINNSKTNVLYFRKRSISKNPSNVNLFIKNYQLKFSSSVRFLGVTLDEALIYDEHRFEIRNKISKNIGILYKLRSVLPEKHLFMLYNSLILPYINYCNNCLDWSRYHQIESHP